MPNAAHRQLSNRCGHTHTHTIHKHRHTATTDPLGQYIPFGISVTQAIITKLISVRQTDALAHLIHTEKQDDTLWVYREFITSSNTLSYRSFLMIVTTW